MYQINKVVGSISKALQHTHTHTHTHSCGFFCVWCSQSVASHIHYIRHLRIIHYRANLLLYLYLKKGITIIEEDKQK